MNKNKLHRILSLVLCFIMILTNMPLNVFADENANGETVLYEIKNIVTRQFKYNGEDKELTLVTVKGTDGEEDCSYFTGDMIFPAGTEGYYCKNISGYYYLNDVCENFQVLIDYDSNGNIKDYDLRLMSDGSIFSYNFFDSYSDNDKYYRICYDNYYIDNNDNLHRLSDDVIISDSVSSMVELIGDIIAIRHTNDEVEYLNGKTKDPVIVLVNETSDSVQLHSGVWSISEDALYGQFRDTRLSYYDETLSEYVFLNTLTPTVNDGEKLQYSLYNDKIIVEMTGPLSNGYNYITTYTDIKVYSMDNSNVSYKDGLFTTDYGTLKFKDANPQPLYNGNGTILYNFEDAKKNIKNVKNSDGTYSLKGSLFPGYYDSPYFDIVNLDTYEFTAKSSNYEFTASINIDEKKIYFATNEGKFVVADMVTSHSLDGIYYSERTTSEGDPYFVIEDYNFNNFIEDELNIYYTLPELYLMIYPNSSMVRVSPSGSMVFNVSSLETNDGSLVFDKTLNKENGDGSLEPIFKIDSINYSGSDNLKIIGYKDLDSICYDYLLKNVPTNSFVDAGNGMVVDSSKNLYQLTEQKTTGNKTEFTFTKTKENIEAVNNTGYYLKNVDGTLKLFKDENELTFNSSSIIKSFDDKMVLMENGEAFYLSNSEKFKVFRATDYNVTIVQESIYKNDTSAYLSVYFDNFVSQIKCPDGTIFNNPDADNIYEVTEDGLYLFEVTNIYGEVFTEKFIVDGLGANLSNFSPTIGIVENNIFVTNKTDSVSIKYSYDRNDWSDYTNEGIKYTNQPIFIKSEVNGLETGIFKIFIENNKATIENMTKPNLDKDSFCGMGYIYDNILYSLDGNVLHIGTSIEEAAVYGEDEYLIKDSNDSSYGKISQYQAAYAEITFVKIFSYSNALSENEIENNPIGIFINDAYTYIVGASGQVVKAKDGQLISEGSGNFSINEWEETWLGEMKSFDKYKGTIELTNGEIIETCYNHSLGIELKDLKFYTSEDVDENYVDSEDDLTPVNVEIVSAKVVSDGYAVLDDTGMVWLYNDYIGDNGAMVSYKKLLPSATLFDFTVEDTSWTNSAVGVTISPSDMSENYWKALDSSSDEYIEFEGSVPDVTEDVPNLILTEATNTVKYKIYQDTYSPDFSEFALIIGTKENDELKALYPTKIIQTNQEGSLSVTYENITDETNFDSSNYKYYYEVEYSVPEGEYFLYSKLSYLDDAELQLSSFKVNDELVNINNYRPAPFKLYDYDDNEINEFKYIEGEGFQVPLESGQYLVDIYDMSSLDTIYFYSAPSEYDLDYMGSGTLNVLNVDTVKPIVETSSDVNGVFTFKGKDINGTEETSDINSAVSGIDKVYWSEDNITFNELLDNQKIVYNKATRSVDTISTQSNVIYVYAVDKANNKSDIKSYTIALDINKSIEYQNNKTIVNFWGDSDTDWTDNNYEYGYYLDANKTNGHTFEISQDKEVKIEVTNVNSQLTKQETLTLEVANVEKPTVEKTSNEKTITIKAGNISNATFDTLYVKIDDAADYTEYTELEIKTSQLALGDHTVKAYQTATKDGQTITSEETTYSVEILELLELNHTITYENGKTILNFYGNDDTTNSVFNYSYSVNSGASTNGHSVELTNDSTVTIIANKDGYEEAKETFDIKVVNVAKPIIDKVTNEKKASIKSDTISNATFDALYVKIDYTGDYTKYTESDIKTSELNPGKHIITAYQTATKDGQTIASDITTYEITITTPIELKHNFIYENGKTILNFYGNDDTNNSLLNYSYSIDTGASTNGHSVELTNDTTVTIVANKEGYEEARQTVDVKVVSVDKPIISKVTNEDKGLIKSNTIKNATFDALYVKIDNAANYTKYTSSEVQTGELSAGKHTVTAYQTATKDGQTITSEVTTYEITVTSPIELKHTITYENGKTVLKFYGNNDTNNTLFNYSYSVNSGTSTNGYSVELTNDSTVTIVANKDGYQEAKKTIDIKVVSVAKPVVDKKDGNILNIKAGTIKNATFDALYVKVDNATNYTKHVKSEIETSQLALGKHTISAYQTAIKDGKIITSEVSTYEITIVSSIDLKYTTSYENGKTVIDFYGNDDTNKTLFNYSYSVNSGTVIKGSSVELSNDSSITIIANKEGYQEAKKTINVKVVSVAKPNISNLNSSNKITVSTGVIKNATFKNLYVKVDNAANFTEYTTQQVVTDKLSLGNHKIEAYQVCEVDGKTIKSNSAVLEVYVYNNNTLYVDSEYSNGSTKVTFYSNDDKKGTEFTYSYDGVKSNKITTDKDITVTLKSTRTNYYDAVKTLKIKVIETEKPSITINDNKLTVVKGKHSNSNFSKMFIKINDEVIESTSDKFEKLLNVGEYDIQVYQMVTLDTDKSVSVNSGYTNKSVKVSMDLTTLFEYENGKTIVSFFADDDKEHSKDYKYSILINGIDFEDYKYEFVNDCSATLKAEKGEKKNSKDLSIKVIETDVPNIYYNENNYELVISVGNINNARLKTMNININGTDYIDRTGYFTLPLEESGVYTITVSQAVENNLNNEYIEIISDEYTDSIIVDIPEIPETPEEVIPEDSETIIEPEEVVPETIPNNNQNVVEESNSVNKLPIIVGSSLIGLILLLFIIFVILDKKKKKKAKEVYIEDTEGFDELMENNNETNEDDDSIN